MNVLPLQLRNGHLFIALGDDLWLFDTGAPTSFGASRSLTIAGAEFSLNTSYLGLTVEDLSQFVGVPCAGLLGADILGCFDHIMGAAGGSLSISTAELMHSGQQVPLDVFMGIPIVTARIGNRDYRMFFDTGAQVSYLQNESLETFPSAGSIVDFYPGVGRFQTDLFEVPISLGGVELRLRCGALPTLLGMTLMMAGAAGILGNEILRNRTIGYFPRRRMMIL